MAKIESPEKIQELPLSVVKNMVTLATSGFGLVVALAWNEFIKTLVSTYINPYLGESSGTISLLIYAVVMTLLAVLVTMQLSGLQKKLEQLNEVVVRKPKSETDPKAKSKR